ncbi:CHAT domain-containing protein [Dactylosporangium sp. CA-092794]|uniref:CHAT domain-containing protein n=1 Tax=Dactylosporangium sp. CA-092794 TaxID=3239929 RepID=UPI003D8AF5DB
MTDGFGRVLIWSAPGDAAHADAVRDLWILLRAAGLDADLYAAPDTTAGPASAEAAQAIGSPRPPGDADRSAAPDATAAAEFASAAAVVVVGSPGLSADGGGDGPAAWRAILDMAGGDEKSAAALVPVLLPGGAPDDLPGPLAALGVHRVRTLSARGTAALTRELRRRCGADAAPRHELRLAVRVADGRLHSTATLAGTVLCERDEPLPFGRDEVWSRLDLPDAEARLARLGQRLSAALFDPDALDQLTTLLAAAVDGTVLDVVVEADGPAHELPFELIRLADQRVLATVDGVRLIRSVTGVRVPDHAPAPGPLKILVAVGAPEHTENPALDVEAEMQAIVSVVGDVGRAEITILEVAGPAEIAEALRRDAYHVLHLSAHGSPYGVELEDRDGNAVDVLAEDLVRALRRGGRPLPLIVLSSCGGAADADAGLAVTLLRHGADRVIAMQTSVTDRYATALLTGVYRALAQDNAPVAAALAGARAALFDEAARAETPQRPEYAVPALFAASDGPLWNPDAAAVPLSNPTELPTGTGVRELLLGDLVGRRGLLRTVTQTLRDEATAAPLVNGVVLTGPAGIGKTALAGRVVNRLRDDVDDPWAITVHAGTWNPPQLLAELTAAGVDLGPDAAGLGEEAADAIADALRTRRVLLVFDDFEQNLTAGGGAFADPGFGEVFGALCRAAERGKVLVTSRYPVPSELPLARVDVPPLSDAELGRLVLRLPGLRDLPGDDRAAVVQAVGGHPRLVEFVDALLHGGARLPEVTARLRTLAKQERISNAGPAGSPAEATRQAIALGARDVLLTELLELLSPDAQEALLQLAVYRSPVSADDLAFAVHGGEPSTADTAATAGHLDRLRDLTLAATGENGAAVEPWLREALAPRHGDRLLDRHLRAAAACQRIVEAGRADFETLVETVHHLRSAERVDELADFAAETLPKLSGELTVAAFLGDVVPGFPAEHPAYLFLIGRERDALEATGSTAAAAAKGDETVRLTTRAAEAAPDDTQAQVALSAALDAQGRLLHRLGRTADARGCYERALTIDRRLAQAEPQDVGYRRNLGLSHQKIAQTALDDAEIARAREAAEASLRIRRELVDADPDEAMLHWDLAIGLGTVAAVHRAAGELVPARDLSTQALDIWRRLAEADADNSALLEHLFDALDALAETFLPGSPDALTGTATAGAPAAGPSETATSGHGADGTETFDDPADAESPDADVTSATANPATAGAGAGKDAGEAERFKELALEAAGIAERLTAADPGNAAYQRKQLAAQWRLGDMDLGAGDLACAAQHFTTALDLAERLAGGDPGSVDAQRDLSTAFRRVADHCAANGQPEEVRGNLERSLEIAEALVHRFPRNGAFHRDVAESRERLGAWLARTGEPAPARALFRQSLASWRRRSTLDPEDLGARVGQAGAHARIAELDEAAGHPGRARRQWQEALDVAEQLAADSPAAEFQALAERYRLKATSSSN